MIDTVGKWIAANQTVFLAFYTIAIVAEVFGFPVSSDLRLFLGLIIYWYLAMISKLPSDRTFHLVLTIFFITFLSYLAHGASAQTERLAVWFVLFFSFGIVRQWREIIS